MSNDDHDDNEGTPSEGGSAGAERGPDGGPVGGIAGGTGDVLEGVGGLLDDSEETEDAGEALATAARYRDARRHQRGRNP